MSGEAYRRRLRALLRLAGIRKRDELSVFEMAFVHQSYAKERGGSSNDRMEFLGDSVLGCITAGWLFEQFSEESEGLLTLRKAAIVNDAQLARTARRLRFSELALLGTGMRAAGGSDNTSVLADAFEAFVGALYLSYGLEKARAFVVKYHVEQLDHSADALLDAKTRLQHYAQEHLAATPVYRETSRGTPQRPAFHSRVTVKGKVLGQGARAVEKDRAASGGRVRTALAHSGKRRRLAARGRDVKLKKIRSFGFKTFAEPTALEFGDGVTAIVGPNGSGKSNLVDAFRWVLGETSTKSIRSGRLEDVIFAGNESRKPLGLAEVSILFDNSDGALPIDFNEVEITRRAYRVGESEYFINRSQVRLRDVLDLVMGTGLGPGSYAIVSQGQIDAILVSKPAERRSLFEETAGIGKFLARKHESMRRLERTEQNAIRISDLIAELERRIPELETQLRRAKRYRRVSARLRDLEILGYLRAGASRRAERLSLRDELERGEERRAAAAAKAATLGAEVTGLRTQLYRCELTARRVALEVAERAQRRRTRRSGVRRRARAPRGARAAIDANLGGRRAGARRARRCSLRRWIS